MNVYTITVAYCPASLLARSLILYDRTRAIHPIRHVVVQGHYPINTKKNNNDIKLICDSFEDIELLDPGKNLGSAQSQNWALSQMDLPNDAIFLNLDPDSACLNEGWDLRLVDGLIAHSNCIVMSCMSPMVQRYRKSADFINEGKYLIPRRPSPFNLSAWRYSFFKEIGGIPQMGLWWGETEGALWQHCQIKGKYHAYCAELMENEDGKFMQDRQQNEWKDLHMRSSEDNRFYGSFDEYLRWRYKELSHIDTCKDLNNHNHP